jgi:teichuronic acid biosynthesis glycosyltransferase TuaH
MAYNALRGEQSFVKGGELVWRERMSWLWRLSAKLYVLDTVVLEPFTTLLLRKRWWPYALKHAAFLAQVRAAARFLAISSPILWLFTPISTPAIGQLSERFVVFDALDNWMTHDGMTAYRQAARRGYEEVRAKADLVFCGSQHTQEMLVGGKPQAFWVPNGIDLATFKPARCDAPADLEGLPRPRIGYSGVVDSRVDVPLLEHCARILTEMSFVFVGSVRRDRRSLHSLRHLPNVHFLGWKRYEQMPGYINAFDVCLIPHKVNPYTDGMNPLKLYEYLACGKPVVSTPVSGTKPFSDVIIVASSPQDFAAAITESLGTNPKLGLQRRHSVSGHSWEARVEQMWHAVKMRLQCHEWEDNLCV